MMTSTFVSWRTTVTFLAFSILAFPSSAQNAFTLLSCAQSCVSSAGISSTGCLPADVKCICSATSWIDGVACCISQSCSASDQETTVKYGQQLCNSVGVTNLPSQASCGSSSSNASSSSSIATSSSSTSSTSPQSTTPVANQGLNTGAKAGIAVGTIAGAGSISVAAFFVFLRCLKSRRANTVPDLPTRNEPGNAIEEKPELPDVSVAKKEATSPLSAMMPQVHSPSAGTMPAELPPNSLHATNDSGDYRGYPRTDTSNSPSTAIELPTYQAYRPPAPSSTITHNNNVAVPPASSISRADEGLPEVVPPQEQARQDEIRRLQEEHAQIQQQRTRLLELQSLHSETERIEARLRDLNRGTY